MDSLAAKWHGLKKAYLDVLTNNLDTITAVEVWSRSLSYIVAGRLSTNHSTVIAELMYSSSHLLTMINDHLLRQHHKLYTEQDVQTRWLKMVLYGIECIEVFIEIAARRYGSPLIRWILIFSIQLVKTIGRCFLLHDHKSRLRLFPLVKPLNRKQMEAESSSDEELLTAGSTSEDSYFTLNHSGRQVKSVASKIRASHLRTPQTEDSMVETPLSREQFLAELMHNLQPMVHVLSMAIFGEKSWVPWFSSLTIDVSSLSVLRKKNYRYTPIEERELVRRKFVLLMYLLRSPFYDKYTKAKVLALLAIMSKIPLFGHVANAVSGYLPEWQRTYFYTWSS